MRTNKYNQTGGAFPLAAAVIPFLKASLPFLGKAALAGGVGFGSSKILGKIFGGSIVRKHRYRCRRRCRRYLLCEKKPYVSQKRFYLGGRRKQTGGFLLPLPFSLGKKLIFGGGVNRRQKRRVRRSAVAIW